VTGAGQEPWPEADPENDLAGFRAARGGTTARFAASQASIIRSLVSQVAVLVGGELAAGEPPDSAASSPVPDTLSPDAPSPEARAPDASVPDSPAPDAPALGPIDELALQLGVTENAELPEDPILARLLPDVYADDPKAAAEFRRYTELGLRSGKVAAAQTVLATLPAGGGRVRLSEADAQAWLRALNDVRLSLGVVLGVTDDFDDQTRELSADDPRAAYIGVYQWLAFLQESLVEALS
jgi:Domain of unknown function (DUF2017)